MTRLVLLLPLVGCATVHFGPDGSGTSVGNPNLGKVSMRMSDEPGFDHHEAVYPVNTIDLEACVGADASWAVHEELDLLGGSVSPIPQGTWCTQTFQPAGNFVVSGTYRDTAYRVEFEEPVVRLEGEWAVEPGKDYIIEFDGLGWLAFFHDPLVRGEEVDYGPDMPFHDLHRTTFETGAALFEDTDGDGELSEDERDEGMISYGDWRDGQGC